MAKKKWKHPEQRPGEVFITNSDNTPNHFLKIGWKTKRRGEIAYDSYHTPLGSKWSGAFPVFVKESEIRKRDPKILKRIKEE